MWRHVDGGLSADFNNSSATFTGRTTFNQMLLGSPVRYGLPQINIFSNGKNLNELNQVFAAGHSLALSTNRPGSFMYDSAAYISRLVSARRTLAAALIDGGQVDQATEYGSNGAFVVTYHYSGGDEVVTVVNPTDKTFNGTLSVRAAMQPDTRWEDWLTSEVFTVTSSGLTIAVPPAQRVCTAQTICGVRILKKSTGR